MHVTARRHASALLRHAYTVTCPIGYEQHKGCCDSQSAGEAQRRGLSVIVQFEAMFETQPVEHSVEALATVQMRPIGGPSTNVPQQKGVPIGQSAGRLHSMVSLPPGH